MLDRASTGFEGASTNRTHVVGDEHGERAPCAVLSTNGFALVNRQFSRGSECHLTHVPMCCNELADNISRKRVMISAIQWPLASFRCNLMR